MIYLTTGANGTGKTLFTLRDVRDLQEKTNRPVYYNGRFALKPEVQVDFGWEKFDFKDWESLPDGSILLVDECHNDLPLRPPSSAPPPYIAALAEHRRRGFDFFFITQHPQNIDAFVRRLIGSPGWHRHLKRIAGAQMVNELRWDSVNPNCEKANSGVSAEKTVRGFPREVFGWYDSAVLHTAKFHIPKAVYIFVFALIGALLLFYFAFRSVTHSDDKKGSVDSSAAPSLGSSPARSPALIPAQQYDDGRAQYLMNHRPYIPSLPHTAPVYASVTQPIRAPVPAACVASVSKCQCYTQQGTRLDTDDKTCRDIVVSGYFLDFDPDGQRASAAASDYGQGSRGSDPLVGARTPQVGGGDQQPLRNVSVSSRAP